MRDLLAGGDGAERVEPQLPALEAAGQRRCARVVNERGRGRERDTSGLPCIVHEAELCQRHGCKGRLQLGSRAKVGAALEGRSLRGLDKRSNCNPPLPLSAPELRHLRVIVLEHKRRVNTVSEASLVPGGGAPGHEAAEEPRQARLALREARGLKLGEGNALE